MQIDFRKATDELCAPITHKDVADALGVSLQSIRQARLKGKTAGYRQPPENWEKRLAVLAEKRIADYKQLLKKLGGNGSRT